jgi:hypothetical protein
MARVAGELIISHVENQIINEFEDYKENQMYYSIQKQKQDEERMLYDIKQQRQE